MVATALIFVTLSDVTPTSAMASTFFRLGAANMLCFTVGPPIAAAIMKKDPWIALTLGLCLQALAIPISLLMPETLGAKRPGEEKAAPESSSSSSSSTPSDSHFQKGSYLKKSKSIFSAIKANSAFITKDWRIVFLASTYPIRMTMGALDGTLLQYVPQRYHWTMADATNLQAVQSGVAMVVLLLLLPAFSSYLLNKVGYTPTKKDILLTRLGFIAYAAGLVITGFAPSIFVFVIGIMVATLASGCGSAIRALLTSWVLPNEVARLYPALGIIETIGSMAGGPAISALYNAGLKASSSGKGDIFLGLPWLIVGSILTALAVVTWMLRFDRGEGRSDAESGAYEEVKMEDDEVRDSVSLDREEEDDENEKVTMSF